jgi:glycerate dehydrogenase
MKIAVLDGYCLNPGDLTWDALRGLGEVEVFDRTNVDEVVSRAQGAEIVLVNKTPLPAHVLEQLPSLRYIGVLATGYNVVDVAAARARGVVVANVPTYGTASVAQFVFALLLELCHRVGMHSDVVRAGEW